MKKLLKYIFIPIFGVFLMSYNANAAQTTIDIGNYSYVGGASAPTINCVFSDSSYNVTNGSVCGANASNVNMSLYQLYTNATYTLNRGDIVEFDFIMYSPTHGLSKLEGVVNRLATIPSTPVFRTLSVTQTANDIFYENKIGTCSGATGSSCTLFNGSVYYSIYHYSLLYVGNDGGVYNIGRTSGSAPMFAWWWGDLEFRLANLVHYRKNEKTEVNQEQKEAADQAISDSESLSEQNSSNAKTTNLIGALSGIFTTISSTSATNCNITGDLGAINMGSLNLCQGKEHFNSLIEFIGFSGLFVVVFWASYHLVKRTLGLIDWARSN